MKTSELINEITKAMSIAQGEIRPASKSTVNPFFKSKYSTLAQVWDVIREPISKNNLTILQDVSSTDHGIAISTRICHASGQWIEFGPLEIPLNKRDAQSVGSATSYGKRYALSAAVGVVSEEDDDGEAAMGRKEEKKKTAPQSNNDHIAQSHDIVDNTPKTVILNQNEEKKYITKEQIKEFNIKYDQCDEEFKKFIDDIVLTLNIKDLSFMQEKSWKKFMLTFQKHFEETKKVG